MYVTMAAGSDQAPAANPAERHARRRSFDYNIATMTSIAAISRLKLACNTRNATLGGKLSERYNLVLRRTLLRLTLCCTFPKGNTARAASPCLDLDP